jgi:hypothetical protein
MKELNINRIYFSVLWACFIYWENLRTIYLFSSSIKLQNIKCVLWVMDMVLTVTFNNISAISWRSVLLVEETRVPGENNWPGGKVDSILLNVIKGQSLWWSYGSWIYNYLSNQYPSSLKLWVQTPFMARCTPAIMRSPRRQPLNKGNYEITILLKHTKFAN